MGTAVCSLISLGPSFLAPLATLVWEALSDLEAPVKPHLGAGECGLDVCLWSFSVLG